MGLCKQAIPLRGDVRDVSTPEQGFCHQRKIVVAEPPQPEHSGRIVDDKAGCGESAVDTPERRAFTRSVTSFLARADGAPLAAAEARHVDALLDDHELPLA